MFGMTAISNTPHGVILLALVIVFYVYYFRVIICNESASVPRIVEVEWSSDGLVISNSTIYETSKSLPIHRHVGPGGNIPSPFLYVRLCGFLVSILFFLR